MLAINGGVPIRKSFLPYAKQSIDDEDIDAVVEVLKSEFLTTGPKIYEFEQRICKYIGCKYAVAVSNATSALYLACRAIDLKEDDEVITTPLTFVASSNCILYCGGKPVFVDINIENYNIDENKIEEKITKNTKAILPVDFTGQSVNIDKIMDIAKKYNLKVIQDASHSLGTKYLDKNIGAIADMTVFSLHPVKTITSGEGGIITTDSKELYEKLILLRTHGITREKHQMINKNYPKWYYEQIDLGYNFRITDIQCALGISQLKKIDKFIKKRRQLVSLYNNLFSNMEEIILQKEEPYSDTSRHLYVVRLNLDKLNVKRDDIYNALICENIGVNLHYVPVYKHPYYKKIGYDDLYLKNTEEVFESIITLPLYVDMSEKDVYDVYYALKKVLNYYKR